MEITPEQQAQLDTWAGKRDALISEVAGLESRKEKLGSEIKDMATSYADIEERRTQYIGRIEELIQKEKDLYSLTPKELVELRIEKSTLQSEITLLKSSVNELNLLKFEAKNDVAFASDVLKSMTERANALESVVGNTMEVNKANVSIIENMVESVKNGLQSIINSNNENVEKTNVVINDLPKVFLEVKRQSLERNTIKKQKHE